MIIEQNLYIDQGTDFITTFLLTDENNNPLDLTGMVAVSNMRWWYTDPIIVAFSMNTLGTDGNVIISLSAAQTTVLESRDYVYDILLTDASGITTKLVKGRIWVSGTAALPS